MTKPNRIRKAIGIIAAVLALGGITTGSESAQAAEEANPYWFDSISQCVDPCPSLEYETCRCFKLPPIIIEA